MAVSRTVAKCFSSFALLATLLCFAAGAKGQVVPESFFGMTKLSPGVPSPLEFGVARSWDFKNVSWDAMNKAPNVFDFTFLDVFLDQNRVRVPNLIYTFGRTPGWASTKPTAPTPYGPGLCASPANLQDWDNFVRATVTHAAGRIKFWELWNEPDLPQYFCDTPEKMLVMAQHASAIIRSIDPSAVILSPASTAGASKWMASFLALGGARYFDALAFHGYGRTAESAVNTIEQYKAVMRSNGISSMPMLDTEASWGSIRSNPLSLDQRAAFISQFYLLHWSEGVSTLVWYSYENPDFGRLVDAGFKPDAAADAYTQTRHWMLGATMTTPCAKDARNIWTCALSRSGGYEARAIWSSASSQSISVPARFTTLRDLKGNMTAITNHTVTIGNQPILVETKPFPWLRPVGN